MYTNDNGHYTGYPNPSAGWGTEVLTHTAQQPWNAGGKYAIIAIIVLQRRLMMKGGK